MSDDDRVAFEHDGIVYVGPPVSQRFLEAFARGELTKGGLAEAGWFDLGTIVGDGPEVTDP